MELATHYATLYTLVDKGSSSATIE